METYNIVITKGLFSEEWTCKYTPDDFPNKETEFTVAHFEFRGPEEGQISPTGYSSHFLTGKILDVKEEIKDLLKDLLPEEIEYRMEKQ